MRKLIFIALLIGFVNLGNAQGVFKLGGNIGFATGDASDFYGAVLGADAYYYFGSPDAFINLGVTGGFRNFFGKDEEFDGQTYSADDIQMVPLAAAGRITILSTLYAGADVGYALAISDDFDGGFYIRPVVGIDIANAIEIFLAYDHYSVKDDFDNSASFGNLNAGILFEL